MRGRLRALVEVVVFYTKGGGAAGGGVRCGEHPTVVAVTRENHVPVRMPEPASEPKLGCSIPQKRKPEPTQYTKRATKEGHSFRRSARASDTKSSVRAGTNSRRSSTRKTRSTDTASSAPSSNPWELTQALCACGARGEGGLVNEGVEGVEGAGEWILFPPILPAKPRYLERQRHVAVAVLHRVEHGCLVLLRSHRGCVFCWGREEERGE